MTRARADDYREVNNFVGITELGYSDGALLGIRHGLNT